LVKLGRKINSWWRLAGVRDALVITGAGVSVFAAIVWLNRFNQSQDVSRQFDADVIVTLAGLATALCFTAALYIFRRVQNLRLERIHRQQAALNNIEQARRLSMVFDNISQGILMFDADKKLVVCNDYYLRMYNLSADIVKPGASLLEIFKHRVEQGNLKRPAEEYCADTLERFAKNEIVHRIVETEDGREIAITDYPIADGGWVATHEDRTEIRRREESFRLLFENNPVAMWLFDRESLKYIAVNDAALASYGYSREQFLSMTVLDTRAGDLTEAEATIRALPDIQNNQNVVQHRRADGSVFPVAICSRIMDYEGRKVRLAAMTDISAQTMAENDLRRTKKFLDTVIENVPIPVVVKNAGDGRFILINKASEDLHGYRREDVVGKTLFDIFPKERASEIAAQDAECLVNGGRTAICDHTISTAKGDRLITTTKVAVAGDSGAPEYIVSLIDDITDRRMAEQRIAHMAHSDPLTDLPNRAAFNERLALTLRQARAENSSFAILCMDLDGFKDINDIYGHAVGDALLCQIADRLREVADGCFVARLGGDEFTLIAANFDRAGLIDMTERLRAAFVKDFDVGDRRLPQASSVGVAVYPADGADAKTLLNNADAALYRAKAAGAGAIEFFKAEMATRLHERAALQADLKSAIQRNELRLHYQPQVKMTGEVKGFEALARWHCPKRGMVPPSEFIPLAEESSLILTLGEWVLREACREAASWELPLKIAINVSPVQFRHGDLPRLVHSILLETGLAANRLELEITEGVLIDDFSRAVSILRRLKTLGVQIALDDFGKGYSSLSYLQKFPFDKIKIDRSFIADLGTNQQSIAIVRAVIGLGRSLHIPILAEGVETVAQHEFLAEEGCNEVQGYLTGKPLAISEYAEVTGLKAQAHAKAS
jgi:diguanylate cyclase (GGDEF)-like protein/PAS domain S-box-containing protein